jgi:alcohol dehydrogenase class IV
VIVGIGGGSVIDTAKALSALLRYGGPAERFLEGVELSMPIPGPAIPWIGVPTTAGTGAEVTKNAVVRSEASGVKRSMRSTHLLASAVIVDPRLTASLPLRETGTSGLDALTQLVEACVSRKSNPLVRSLVRGAFAPMFDALEGLPRDPGNLGLRSAASYGALVSGIALANAGLGAAHGFAAAVGGLYGVPHGLACAIFLPLVLEANAAEIRGILAELVEVKAPGTADPVGWLADKVRSMVDAFSLPADLKGFAIPREGIPDLAQKASGASMKGNPRELSQEERMRIISRVV